MRYQSLAGFPSPISASSFTHLVFSIAEHCDFAPRIFSDRFLVFKLAVAQIVAIAIPLALGQIVGGVQGKESLDW